MRININVVDFQVFFVENTFVYDGLFQMTTI